MEDTSIEISKYFQDHMPGNVCFGCGSDNPQGLQIKSYWEGDEAICTWHSKEHFHGWASLLNGGVMATLVDCHCMCTAMAYAYKIEHRELNTAPHYKYATGTLTIKYLKPTSNDHPVLLKAKVLEAKGRKTTVSCQIYSQDILTATAEVIAIRVFDSSKDQEDSKFV